MKHAPENEFLETARRLRCITRGTGTLFIVNDNVDVARRAHADGVHLGRDDMPLPQARRLWPAEGKLFGLSTHDEDQAAAAVQLKPDYIGVGPVYATPTKDVPDPTVGLERMGKIIASCPLTTVAIGGINTGNLPHVLRAGAINFAVVRAVNQSPKPRRAIVELMDIWRSHVR